MKRICSKENNLFENRPHLKRAAKLSLIELPPLKVYPFPFKYFIVFLFFFTFIEKKVIKDFTQISLEHNLNEASY